MHFLKSFFMTLKEGVKCIICWHLWTTIVKILFLHAQISQLNNLNTYAHILVFKSHEHGIIEFDAHPHISCKIEIEQFCKVDGKDPLILFPAKFLQSTLSHY
jgi:hypothetical protein